MEEHRDHVLAFERRLREAGRALELEKIVVLPLEIGERFARQVGRGGRCHDQQDRRRLLQEDHHADDPECRVRDRERGAETDHLVEDLHLVVRQPDRDVDQHPADDVGEEGRAEERDPE
jgi:hypothetical protein